MKQYLKVIGIVLITSVVGMVTAKAYFCGPNNSVHVSANVTWLSTESVVEVNMSMRKQACAIAGNKGGCSGMTDDNTLSARYKDGRNIFEPDYSRVGAAWMYNGQYGSDGYNGSN